MSEVTEADLERLSAWLDGELPEEERDALEARLAAEPALARELEALQATLGVVETLEVPEPPDAFAENVRRRIRRRSRGRYFGRQRRPTHALESTAWALLIVLGIVVVGSLSAPVVLETPPAPPPEAEAIDPDSRGATEEPTQRDEAADDAEPEASVHPPRDAAQSVDSEAFHEAMEARDAPALQGQVSGLERRALRRFGFAWQVATDRELSTLRREAVERFGASRVIADEHGVTVQLDAAGWEEGLRRASQMGTLYRERVELQGGPEASRRVRLLPAGVPPRGEPLR